ncbi:MAG: FliM/FliN family flagellar motor C-terminal domain-containing protein, partial [Planctomycetota bacterium]
KTGSEFTRITLSQSEAPSGERISIFVASENLDAVARTQAKHTQAGPSGNNRERMATHVMRGVIKTTAWLGTARANVEEILELEVGDVLLLRKKINEPIEPIELLIRDRRICQGKLVQSGGNYGVQIVVPVG